MKQLLYFTSVLLLLSSCSTLDNIDYLVHKAEPEYKMKLIEGTTYTAEVPYLTYNRRIEYDRQFEYWNQLRKKPIYNMSELELAEFNNYRNIFENPIAYDSTGFISVSFDETYATKNKLELKNIYYWDYSNGRFLVPFLPFFNEQHKRNQCVNRAIEACYKNNMNQVVISPTLNHFKLYK